MPDTNASLKTLGQLCVDMIRFNHSQINSNAEYPLQHASTQNNFEKRYSSQEEFDDIHLAGVVAEKIKVEKHFQAKKDADEDHLDSIQEAYSQT